MLAKKTTLVYSAVLAFVAKPRYAVVCLPVQEEAKATVRMTGFSSKNVTVPRT